MALDAWMLHSLSKHLSGVLSQVEVSLLAAEWPQWASAWGTKAGGEEAGF